MFLSLEHSISLKELGFVDDSYAYWEHFSNDTKKERIVKLCKSNIYDFKDQPNNLIVTLSPSYEQAFEWFMKNYGYNSWISPMLGHGEYHYYIQSEKRPYYIIKSNDGNDHKYMKDRLLEKLIELGKTVVESQKDEDI